MHVCGFSKNQGGICRHPRSEARNESPMTRKVISGCKRTRNVFRSQPCKPETLGPCSSPRNRPKTPQNRPRTRLGPSGPVRAQNVAGQGKEVCVSKPCTSSVRRTPLHLGLQIAFNTVCNGQLPIPPLTHSNMQNQ